MLDAITGGVLVRSEVSVNCLIGEVLVRVEVRVNFSPSLFLRNHHGDCCCHGVSPARNGILCHVVATGR